MKKNGILELEKENITIKYEFKMLLKSLDDLDYYEYKFNFFTKNVL